ncbi:MAG: FxsA family protein [Porticoccaceae bacterium]|nr:FxsA family protein [Porticoccaceae bacterium]
MRFLFLLLIAMPVVEMWLLIHVGSEIGAFYTIGLVLLTAIIGVRLLRQQGFDTLWRGQRKLEEGQLPAQEIGEGIVLAVSGALLLTPGFITDAIGFAGLFPPLRSLFIRQLLSKMVVADMQGNSFRANRGPVQDGDIIEGESWDKSDAVEKTDPQKNNDLR